MRENEENNYIRMPIINVHQKTTSQQGTDCALLAILVEYVLHTNQYLMGENEPASCVAIAIVLA